MILVDDKKIKLNEEKGFWGKETLFNIFEKNVAKFQKNIAVIDPLNKQDICGGESRTYTYQELSDEVDRLTTYLIKFGIRKNDIIAVQLPNVSEMIVTYLSLLKIGAIVTPLPAQYRKQEYITQLNIAKAKAVISMSNITGYDAATAFLNAKHEIPSLELVFAWGEGIPEGIISLNELTLTEDDEESADNILASYDFSANEIFSICWTSGTEGVPKGVPRSHNEWIISAYASVDAGEFTSDSVLLNTFPMVNMAGIGGMFVPWLLAGCKLVMHHPFDLPTFLKQIAIEKITYTLAPPALLNMMIHNEAILEHADLSSLKSIGSGSTPLSPWMVKGWKDKYNIDIINYFGSNEGATFISSPKDIPDPEKRANYFPRLGVEGLNWGIRIANYFESKLVDIETGETISESGKVGEMRIRGASVLPKYWGENDENTDAFDEDGFFKTGDLFEIVEENGVQKYYRFVDRLKEIIIRGGMNISPFEVETILQKHPKISEVSVVGIPDEIMGEKACACVVLKDKDKILTVEEIVNYFKENNYAIFKAPEYLYFVEELPRNPVGKIMKYELRNQFLNAQDKVV